MYSTREELLPPKDELANTELNARKANQGVRFNALAESDTAGLCKGTNGKQETKMTNVIWILRSCAVLLILILFHGNVAGRVQTPRERAEGDASISTKVP